MPMHNPAHPGELIRETLEGLQEETGRKLTIKELAEGLGTSRTVLSAVINGRQDITPEMALRLSKAFQTTPEFWLHAQENYKLAQARKTVDTHDVRIFWKQGLAG